MILIQKLLSCFVKRLSRPFRNLEYRLYLSAVLQAIDISNLTGFIIADFIGFFKGFCHCRIVSFILLFLCILYTIDCLNLLYVTNSLS